MQQDKFNLASQFDEDTDSIEGGVGAFPILLPIAFLRCSSHGATLRETRCNATNNCSRDELVEMQIESVERRTEQDGTERLTLAHQPSASPGQRNQESESNRVEPNDWQDSN